MKTFSSIIDSETWTTINFSVMEVDMDDVSYLLKLKMPSQTEGKQCHCPPSRWHTSQIRFLLYYSLNRKEVFLEA